MVFRLVLCLDGTWNTADAENITNIVRIRDLIDPRPTSVPNESDEQLVYYHVGVGTGLSIADRVRGGVSGAGLEPNIRAAYKFLSQNYRDECEIYIFGFSRGAFTARSLLAYMTASGLLRPECCSAENERRAWKYYSTPPDQRYPQQRKALEALCYPNVRVRCIGVFDTVGALGVPIEVFANWNRQRFQFHDVNLSRNVDFAFHALAIDEKRGPFQASLWQYPNHKDFTCVEQVWFTGVHSNVGGGYPDRGLSDISMKWMLSRIQEKNLGLRLLPDWDKTLSPNIVQGKLYDSRSLAYTYSRIRPMLRSINQQRPSLNRLARASALPPNAIPIGEMIHASSLFRWKQEEQKAHPEYSPPNLAAALDAMFNLKDTKPIPIVNEIGKALDWINSDDDLAVLTSVLPTKYEKCCDQLVKKYRGQPGSEAFSTPYEEPRIPISKRALQKE